jgi:hypothetical protein
MHIDPSRCPHWAVRTTTITVTALALAGLLAACGDDDGGAAGTAATLRILRR